jgi:hypothetical protein
MIGVGLFFPKKMCGFLGFSDHWDLAMIAQMGESQGFSTGTNLR